MEAGRKAAEAHQTPRNPSIKGGRATALQEPHCFSGGSSQIWILKEGVDEELIQRRIDDGKFDPTGYDRRFIQKITDYLI